MQWSNCIEEEGEARGVLGPQYVIVWSAVLSLTIGHST